MTGGGGQPAAGRRIKTRRPASLGHAGKIGESDVHYSSAVLSPAPAALDFGGG